MPNDLAGPHGPTSKAPAVQEGLAAYQVVGEVMAHQADDG